MLCRESDPARAESGAAAVEFALVSTLLFTILFGIIQYGLYFNDALSTRQGVREGARQGVVRNFVACGSESTDMGKLKCDTRRQIDALTGTEYVKVIFPPVWKKTAPLIVCAMVKSDGGIGLLPMPNDGWISSSTQMSIEQDTTPVPDRDHRRGHPAFRGDVDVLRLVARRRASRDEHGLVAVMFALMAMILLILCALVVDLGLARDTRRQAQNAADASSLAAANVLYPTSGVCASGTPPSTPPCFDDAIAEAKSYAQANFKVSAADWSSCTDSDHYYVPPSSTACISFADDTLATTRPAQPTKVRVLVPTRTVQTAFGFLAGTTQIPISASARTALTPGSARSCGLCLLGTGVSGLGNGDVSVIGGSVHSNGTIDSGPNGHMTATPSPNTISVSGTCPGNCSPAAMEGVATIDDPYLTTVALPPTSEMAGLQVKTDPCTQGPGRYAAVNLPNSLCTLSPGLYVLTGTWEMGNNTLLKGITGVTLYATCGTAATPTVCTSGQTGGRLDTKNGDTQLVAPTTGVLKGMAIIYDRQNNAALNIQGNGNSYVTGAIYAPKALLEFPGTTCVTVTNGPIIVNSLYGNGNTGCVNLQSVLGANIPAPPAGASLDR